MQTAQFIYTWAVPILIIVWTGFCITIGYIFCNLHWVHRIHGRPQKQGQPIRPLHQPDRPQVKG